MEDNAAKNIPILITIKPGLHSWCSCGHSKTEPLCDGSHIGKGFCPVTFKVTEPDQPVALCLCKHTGNKPYCDGSHSRL